MDNIKTVKRLLLNKSLFINGVLFDIGTNYGRSKSCTFCDIGKVREPPLSCYKVCGKFGEKKFFKLVNHG